MRREIMARYKCWNGDILSNQHFFFRTYFPWSGKFSKGTFSRKIFFIKDANVTSCSYSWFLWYYHKVQEKPLEETKMLQADEAVPVRPKRETNAPKWRTKMCRVFMLKLRQNCSKLHLQPTCTNKTMLDQRRWQRLTVLTSNIKHWEAQPIQAASHKHWGATTDAPIPPGLRLITAPSIKSPLMSFLIRKEPETAELLYSGTHKLFSP